MVPQQHNLTYHGVRCAIATWQEWKTNYVSDEIKIDFFSLVQYKRAYFTFSWTLLQDSDSLTSSSFAIKYPFLAWFAGRISSLFFCNKIKRHTGTRMIYFFNCNILNKTSNCHIENSDTYLIIYFSLALGMNLS